MPGKSRHGKGKHHHRSKKSKAIRRHSTVAAPPVKTQAPAATVPAAPTPSPKAVGTPAKTTTIQYPYFEGEMRRIAIFAAITIVILFILFFIIS